AERREQARSGEREEDEPGGAVRPGQHLGPDAEDDVHHPVAEHRERLAGQQEPDVVAPEERLHGHAWSPTWERSWPATRKPSRARTQGGCVRSVRGRPRTRPCAGLQPAGLTTVSGSVTTYARVSLKSPETVLPRTTSVGPGSRPMSSPIAKSEARS